VTDEEASGGGAGNTRLAETTRSDKGSSSVMYLQE
jgi:hypothetical protein